MGDWKESGPETCVHSHLDIGLVLTDFNCDKIAVWDGEFLPFWPGVLSDAGRRSVKTLKLEMFAMFANCVWFVILQAKYIHSLNKRKDIYIYCLYVYCGFLWKDTSSYYMEGGPKPTSRTCPLPHYNHLVGWKFDIDTKHWFGAYYTCFFYCFQYPCWI